MQYNCMYVQIYCEFQKTCYFKIDVILLNKHLLYIHMHISSNLLFIHSFASYLYFLVLLLFCSNNFLFAICIVFNVDFGLSITLEIYIHIFIYFYVSIYMWYAYIYVYYLILNRRLKTRIKIPLFV